MTTDGKKIIDLKLNIFPQGKEKPWIFKIYFDKPYEFRNVANIIDQENEQIVTQKET